MKQKKSPTWRDVSEAKDKGVNIALAITLTVLKDKMGFDND